MLQMVAYDSTYPTKPERINLDAHKEWMTDESLKVYE